MSTEINSRLYDPAKLAVVRELYATRTAAQIAERLWGSPRCAQLVFRMAHRLGLRKQPDRRELHDVVRRLHAEGLTDRAVATRLSITMDAAKDIRRMRLKLSANPDLDGKRRAVAAQLRTLGLTSPTQLRTRAFRRYAVENGWPAHLRPREVQILNVLAERGPQTAKELALAIGMSATGKHSTGTRRVLLCDGCQRLDGGRLYGTYTARLLHLGLILYVGRYGPGGRGKIRRQPGHYLLSHAAIAIKEATCSATA